MNGAKVNKMQERTEIRVLMIQSFRAQRYYPQSLKSCQAQNTMNVNNGQWEQQGTGLHTTRAQTEVIQPVG